MVWSETNRLGCGFSRCSEVRGLENSGVRYILVCQYSPQGNVVYLDEFGRYKSIPAFEKARSPKQVRFFLIIGTYVVCF